MSGEKYIGLDVHQATTYAAVMDPMGNVIIESLLETKAATIREFFARLRGTLSVTFEEGTWAAWHYDLLKPRVANLVVCNPRKIALLQHGNKSDKIDARKVAHRLCLNDLESVYHGETGVRMLRELARSYLTIVKDLSRVMNRLKALYRRWAIPCAGRDVYYTRHRSEWLGKIPEAGTRRRAEQLFQQLDMLQHLRQQTREWPRPSTGRYGSAFEQILQIVIMVVIQTAHGDTLPVSSKLPPHKPALAAVVTLDCETTVSPQLSLGTETVWRLQQRHQQGGSPTLEQSGWVEITQRKLPLLLRV